MAAARSAFAGPASTSGALSFDRISHAYETRGRRTEVLCDVSFSVPAGTVACVVGPSGCGKSTLLSLAAGLMRPSAGQATWDGKPVVIGPTAHLGMAFQQPGLFPWMTVRRNVEIGLLTRGSTKAEARATADTFLDAVGLAEFKTAYPSQLSGGMAQRVGIARAFALKPRLLLMDEPFAAVDAFTRLKLQHELKTLLRQVRPTLLFVTHDVAEAILLGDVIVVMSPRPASVARIVPIDPAEQDRSGAAYAHKLAEVLDCLGVKEGAQ